MPARQRTRDTIRCDSCPNQVVVTAIQVAPLYKFGSYWLPLYDKAAKLGWRFYKFPPAWNRDDYERLIACPQCVAGQQLMFHEPVSRVRLGPGS